MIIMTWKSTYCTVHCTLYTVHWTLYTVHIVMGPCALYTVHCTLYSVQLLCFMLIGILCQAVVILFYSCSLNGNKLYNLKIKAFLKYHSLKIKFYSRPYPPFLIQTRWIPENIYFHKLIAFICLKDQNYFDCMLQLSPLFL